MRAVLLLATLLCSTPINLFADSLASPDKEESYTDTSVKTFSQKIKFDLNNHPDYSMETNVKGLTILTKPCGSHCSDITLTTSLKFIVGDLLITMVHTTKSQPGITSRCEAKVKLAFDVQYGYLVTPMTDYILDWKPTNEKPCPPNLLSLNVDGDPTDPNGYSFTLIDTKPGSQTTKKD